MLKKIVSFRRFNELVIKLKDKKLLSKNKTIVFAFRINDWKRKHLELVYPNLYLIFIPFKKNAWHFHLLIKMVKNPIFLVWGYNESRITRAYAVKRDIEIWRIEDGFIRSIGLGADHTLPLSLVLDRTGVLYFDARKSSGLEDILQNYDFSSDFDLMDRALKSIKKIKKLRISKYNLTEKAANEAVYNQFGEIKLGQKRILVIGQVEDDASIIYGSPHCSSNGYLVWKARQRNPDAQIFFRPHPDTVAGKRKVKTSLSEIENISHVIYSSMSLASAFNSIDEVYTITSLSGFEALMHGKHVVTLGNPFYAGWGLTEDLHPLDRRKRKLSVEEVFAAAYILYPNYNNPFTGETMDLNDAISMISLGIEHRKVRESIMGELN